MKRWWMVMVCSVLLMTGCAGSSTPAPAPPERPALLTDHLGSAQDLIPTEAEIAAARTALGTKGFIAVVACNLGSEYHAAVPRAAQALADKLEHIANGLMA